MSIRKAAEAARNYVFDEAKAQQMGERNRTSQRKFDKYVSAKAVSKELLSKTYSL